MATEESNRPQVPSPRLVPVPDPTTLTNQLVAQAVSALRELLDARISALEKRIDVDETAQARHVDSVASNLEALLSAKIKANAEAINVLRSAGEESIKALHGLVEQRTGERNIALQALHNLMDEKIAALTETVAVFKTSVNERFQLGDVQTEKAARDVKSAVDAAFAAAKEAVGEQNKSNALSIAKSEVGTTKQIDQLAENARVSAKNADDKISDLKDRILAMEARASIADPSTTLALREMSNSLASLKALNDQSQGGRTQRIESSAWVFGVIGAIVAGGVLILDLLKLH
jgi:hypothetical protein